jgi:mannosyl-3-phosphoglycerate phosphatase family protein
MGAVTRQVVVFTDVDGCILDASTYAPGPARSAIRRLGQRGVPVILCTSRTRAEVVALETRLGRRSIAIVESGAAVLIPPRFLPRHPPGARRVRAGWFLPLAAPYAEVRVALAELRQALGGGIRGFGDMTAREVAERTGLPLEDARRARRREFDEPFVFEGDQARLHDALRAVLPARGLAWSRGGRFHHLHGDVDKGRAVRVVTGWLRELWPAPYTIALGDSPHDLPMLREADQAVIVPLPGGNADPSLHRSLPRALMAVAPGPVGWARAVGALVP